MKTKVEELNGRLNTEKEKRKQLENGIKEKEIEIDTDSSELNRIQNEIKDKTQKIPLMESEKTELQDLTDKVCRPGNNISFNFQGHFRKKIGLIIEIFLQRSITKNVLKK